MRIDNLKGVSNQDIFNFVAKKMIEQGCASVNEDNNCLYRGPNGTKCSLGHLIPEDLYKKYFEGNCFERLLITEAWEVTEDQSRLISGLQDLHDLVLIERLEEDYKDIFSDFANKAGLKPLT